MSIRYHVVEAPGCHSRPVARVLSRHRTLRAAVRAARCSDRVRVEPADRAVCLYQASSSQPTPWGHGLYGGADTLTLAEALQIAQRRASDLDEAS